jgi:NAD(P)-dependent dehydrogenase (short-subunit alcohol dehydrogenase family)
VGATQRHFGRIDVQLANAVVDLGKSSLDTNWTDWVAALQVNLMAHMRAIQRLAPPWPDGGAGRFVVTDAAGLLTMLGSAPHSVTKQHGVVAFAEWLWVTYNYKGVTV